MAGCGGGNDSTSFQGWGFEDDTPAIVENHAAITPIPPVCEQIETGSITLSWAPPDSNADGTPLSDLAGYIVYIGTFPGQYAQSLDIGNETLVTIDNLAPGTWYFAITAYDLSDNESDFSEELCLLF